MKNRFYVITGVMAAGKSTIAEALAQRLPKAVHVRGDVFRRMIITGREEMTDNASTEALFQLDLRYKIAAQVATMYYENGFDVVVQDNYLGEGLAAFLSFLHSIDTEVIVLCPSADAVRERERARDKTGYVGFTVDSLYDMFVKETPRIGRWIDTTHMTVDETVDEILKNK